MQQTFDIEIRVLSCESCGAPVRASEAGGTIQCDYCGTQMLLARRKLEPVRLGDGLRGDARIAKLRLQTGRALPENPYSTVRPPPGCEALTHSGQAAAIDQLAVRLREAIALVRAEPSFDHQRLLWWCATMLNQGYGLNGKHLECRAVLERAIEELADPGFRHMLYVNLAGAAARAGEVAAARAWIDKCEPEPDDIMLDSGYRIGLASVFVREGLVREGPARAAELLALVGAKHGEVPEAFQYRMLFALYRIHAHELRGDQAAAVAAATTIMSDPEVGGLLTEALRLNELGPATAAMLEVRGIGARSSPAGPTDAVAASLAKLDRVDITTDAKGGPDIAVLVLVILLIVFAAVGVIIALIVIPAFQRAGAI